MLIEDDRAFSVMIPNKDGQDFLRRTLDYFVDLEFAGHIVICDSSEEGVAQEFVGHCQNAYPNLWLDVYQYPPQTRFLDKLCECLRATDSEYVLLHANDDFMVPAEVNRCIEAMEGDSGLSAARGRIAMFSFETARGENDAPPIVNLYPYPMRAYLDPDPITRALDMLERYTATFYSVHRRQVLLENFSTTEQATKNVIFFQYLSSALLALQGRIWCGDGLFYVRQAHAQMMGARLSRDYEHWPLLITSDNFSRYYREFRDSICRWSREKLGVAETTLSPRIDMAAAEGLLDRGYCRRPPSAAEDERFMGRLNDDSTSDYREFKRVIDFASQYPQTF